MSGPERFNPVLFEDRFHPRLHPAFGRKEDAKSQSLLSAIKSQSSVLPFTHSLIHFFKTNIYLAGAF